MIVSASIQQVSVLLYIFEKTYKKEYHHEICLMVIWRQTYFVSGLSNDVVSYIRSYCEILQ